MATATNIPIKRQWSEGDRDAMRALIKEWNELVTDFRALLAKLDADTGVNDTNYASTLDAKVSKFDVL